MKSSVPYFDLTRQYEQLREEIEAAIIQVNRSGAFILGPAVQAFEKTFADYCGAKFGLGVGSGTDALTFALRALGIGKGDEVILPSFTFIATGFAILQAGANPVFADVHPETYTLDPKSVERAITKRTKVILPVHLYGQVADMTSLMAIAKKKKLKIVEDACQAHGATFQAVKAGAFGDAGCFSFYPTKNLGAFGDGGMILTSQQKLVEKIQRLRNLGRLTTTGPHQEIGWTSRLDSLQAAILNVKLKYLDPMIEKRRKIAARYQQNLSSTPLGLPRDGKDSKHVYHLYVVLVPGGRRDAFRAYLAEQGIRTLLHYDLPIHRQPPFKKIVRHVPLTTTDKLSREIVSLPIFPEMTMEEVDRVSEVIKDFYKNG
ncbi:MAG: DegT/DnrJ/EryC1/StrS family aminotransferase [Candidatus Omnitrophica bacterium]|nr:DegT/DnrJ/EryC1/StrS family aminotransferase [Candidatus Omnitrophota bacterium]